VAAHDLADTRPVKVVREGRARFQDTLLQPAVSLFCRMIDLLLRGSFPG
jgi:hypothetical protein